MFAHLSFNTKLATLIGLGVVLSSILGLAGYTGIAKLEIALNKQSESANLLRSGLMSDMMHDAVVSDVMSAMYRSADAANDPKIREEAENSFTEHDKAFRHHIDNLAKADLEAHEQVQVKQVSADVMNYLNSAGSIIKLAFQDRNSAEHNLAAFEQQFRTLEVSLDKLGDTLENKIKQIETESNAINQVAYQILALTLLIGLIAFVLVAFLIQRAIARDLGEDPAHLHAIAAKISAGDLSTVITVKASDKSSVLFAMNTIKQALNNLIDDSHILTQAVMSGDISSRSDNKRHQGAFGELLLGVNQTLDAVVDPLTLTATYIDLIAKGDLPPKIAIKKGDLNLINTIKTNLNTTIDTLNSFVSEMQHMSDQHNLGDIDVMIDSSRFTGSYQTMANGVNKMVAGHLAVKKKAMAVVMAFGDGDFNAPLEQFPGKKAFINHTIEQVRTNLKALITDTSLLASEAQAGNLSVRVDVNRHTGDFKKIIAGINNALDSIITPVQETITQITEYSRGNMSGVLSAEYKGDFAELKKRLNNLALTMKGVADSCGYVRNDHDKGEIESMVAAERFKGDFGVMANNINSVIVSHIELNQKAMTCVREFGEGNFEAPLEQFPGKKAFINDIVEQVRSNLKALIADINMLSDAALEGRIQVRADASKHHGDFRKIIEGINATLETIVNPIVTVKTAVDSISTAAKEISAGNADLSHRTEQQAASLEETASSMEQLASTVKQNAENAKNATQMAAAASDVASKGGGVVQEVVTTMYSINESAGKIVDIISVIDGIALQTNILALNAAVEAARAGEQGRGFAVVASEVRNLAQRSAAAAKEIKALIGDSVEKVENGSKLVAEAGKTMDEIVLSVKRVTDIMGDIAVASQEQSSGIEQVKQAVSQMDDVTQQNAALVEEAAAAAESLEEQAEALSNAVSQFRLDSDIGYMPVKSHKTLAPPPKKITTAGKSLAIDDSEWSEF